MLKTKNFTKMFSIYPITNLFVSSDLISYDISADMLKDNSINISENILCTYKYFGSNKMNQPVFYCTSCDPSRSHMLCGYCHQICHHDCIKRAADCEEMSQHFVCYCGERLNHKPPIISMTDLELKECHMHEFDVEMEILSNFQCKEEGIKELCSICYKECHKHCEKSITDIGHLLASQCRCRHTNHQKENNATYRGAIQDYMAGIKSNQNIWPVNVLNVLYSSRYFQFQYSLEFFDCLTQKFFFSVQAFCRTFARDGKFKTYYFNDEILTNLFPIHLFQKIREYIKQNTMKKEENINQQTLKFGLFYLLLFIHMKRDFQYLKSFTSADFLSNSLLERLEFQTFIKYNSKYTEGFLKNVSLYGDLSRYLINYTTECITKKELHDEFEIPLKIVCFLLKRKIFNQEILLQIIDGIYNFQGQYYYHLANNNVKREVVWIIIPLLIEICFLISINFNDLIISNYFQSNDNISSFIHKNTTRADNEKSKVFKMAIQNCKAFAEYYRAPNEYNGMKDIKQVIQMAHETLKLFSLVDNSYYNQIKNITSEDREKYLERMRFYQSPQNIKQVDSDFFEKKKEIEEILRCFFTKIPSQRDYDRLLQYLDIILTFFDQQLSSFPIYVNNQRNFVIKNYALFKHLNTEKSIRKSETDKLIDNLIFSQFDETLSKVLFLFTEQDQYHNSLLKSSHVNNILSVLLLFLSSKRGLKYLLTGKILSRIEKTLSNCLKKENGDVINSDITDNRWIIGLILEFLFLLFKRIKHFALEIKGHKILFRLKGTLLNIVGDYVKGKNINDIIGIKIQIELILKIFYLLCDNFEDEIEEEIKKQMLILFNQQNDHFLNLTKLLQSFQINEPVKIVEDNNKYIHSSKRVYDSDTQPLINSLDKSPERELLSSSSNFFCCGKILLFKDNQQESVLNIRIFFSFFLLISKNTYYVYNDNDSHLRFLYDQDINIYQNILSSNSVCLKHRKALLRFLRTFYFIDRLNKIDYNTREVYITNDEFAQFIYYLQEHPRMEINENYKKYQNYKYPTLIRPIEMEINEETFKYLERKKLHGDHICMVMKIFQNEIENYPRNFNSTNAKAEKLGEYIRELLLGIQFISDFFVSEKDILKYILAVFRELACSLIENSSKFVNDYLISCPREDNQHLTTNQHYSDQKYIDQIRNLAFNREELFNVVPEMLSDIFERTGINSKHCLARFLLSYDKRVEMNFSSLDLTNPKDYEYFYEDKYPKVEETHKREDKSTDLEKLIITQYEKQFTNIDFTVFLYVLRSFCKEVEIDDYLQYIVDYFVAFMNFPDKTFSQYECMIYIITKTLFYETPVTNQKFSSIPPDEMLNILSMLKNTLRENIVHIMTLSKNFFLDKKILRISNVTKLTLEFLKLLKEPSFRRQIFGLKVHAHPNRENVYQFPDDKNANDSLFGLIDHSIISCYKLISPENIVKYETSYDDLIVLLTNLNEFIQTFIDTPDHAIQNKMLDFMKKLFDNHIFKCFFMKINSPDKEYSLRKNIMSYIKIQFCRVLYLYLQRGESIISDKENNNTTTHRTLMEYEKAGQQRVLEIHPIDEIQDEENENNSKKKGELVKKFIKDFHPSKLFNEVVDNFKILLTNYNISEIESTSKGKKRDRRNEDFLRDLELKYIFDENFQEDLQLKVCFNLFILIKTLEDDYFVDDVKQMFNIINREHEMLNETLYIFKFFNPLRSKLDYKVYLFLNKLVIKVDVLKSLDCKEKEKIEIYFIRPSLTFYLSLQTRWDFEQNVNRETAVSKFNDLISNCDYFIFEMKYSSKRFQSQFQYLIFKHTQMFYMHLVNYLFIVVHNVLLVVQYYRSPDIPEQLYYLDRKMDVIPMMNYWLVIAHGLFIAIVIYFSFLYAPISFQKTIMENQKTNFILKTRGDQGLVVKKEVYEYFKDKSSFFLKYNLSTEKLWTLGFYSMIRDGRRVIFLIVIALLFLFFHTSHPIWIVIPAVFVVYVNNNLWNILRAVQMRWKSLLTVLLFTYLCVYVFTWFSLLYFRDIFSFDVTEINSGGKVNENFCMSTLQCFMMMIDFGMRNGGGIGDQLDSVSYKSNTAFFVKRFFYVMLFHIIIILILNNVFLGIIVDTFADLRDATQRKEDDVMDVCFICQMRRTDARKKNIDFDVHRREKHNMWNYVYFVTYLHIVSPHNFSSIEAYVWKKLCDQDITWIPLESD